MLDFFDFVEAIVTLMKITITAVAPKNTPIRRRTFFHTSGQAAHWKFVLET